MSSKSVLKIFFQVLVVLVASKSIISAKVVRLSENTEDDDVDQIVGGTTVKKGNHRYMAYLRIFTASGTTMSCGGTVIDGNHILTAAHCVADTQGKLHEKVEVNMRVYSINPMDTTVVQRIVLKKDIRVHEQYNPSLVINDIAILKTSEPFALNLYDAAEISRAFLPLAGSVTKDYSGQIVTAVGWGLTSSAGTRTSTMQQVNLQIGTEEECKARWGATYRHEVHLCHVTPNKSVCSGDSGGPILVNEGGYIWIPVGINSFVPSSATGQIQCENGAVFTRVSTYINNGWIKNNTV